MAKFRPNKHTTYLHGPGGLVPIEVPVRPATKPLIARRRKRHVEMGEEGKPCTCANAHAYADEHGGAWEFTDSRAYRFKRTKKGKLIEAEYWTHNQGAFQRKFDKIGKRAMMNSPDCEGDVRLSVPPQYEPRNGYRETSRNGTRLERRQKRAQNGGVALFARAGIVAVEPVINKPF